MKGLNSFLARRDRSADFRFDFTFPAMILSVIFAISVTIHHFPGSPNPVHGEDMLAADAEFNGNMALTTGGEYEIARDGWEEFLRKYPENSQRSYAEYYLAYCQMKTGEYAEAEKKFQKILAEGEFPNQDEAVLFLGMTFLKHAVSLPIQQTGSRRGTVNTVADRTYAITPEAAALCRMAIQQFQTIRVSFPDSTYRMDASYQEALTYIQLGNYENALGDLKLVVATQHFEEQDNALYTLSEVYLNLQQPDEKSAMVTLQTLIARDPETTLKLKAQRLLGDIYFRLGDYALASELFAEIWSSEAYAPLLKTKKGNVPPVNLAFFCYRTAETHVKMERYEEAVEMFGRVVEEFPKSTVYLHACYQKALAMKKFNENLPEGAEAFETEEYQKLWEYTVQESDSKKDRTLRNHAIHQLVLLHLRNEAPKLALETLEQVPEKQRTKILLRDQADTLAACGRIDEAVAIYRRLFGLYQKPDTLIHGADAMLQAVRLRTAEEDHADVLLLSEEVIRWDAFTRLPERLQIEFLEENMKAFFRSGNYEEARNCGKRLLERFPDSKERDEWRILTAHAYLQAKQHLNGFRFIKGCLTSITEDSLECVELRHIQGICYREYAQTRKSPKKREQYFLNAQYALTDAKQTAKKMEREYEALSVLYYDLALVYFQTKQYDRCVKNLKSALKRFPDSDIAPQLLFLKGRCEIETDMLEDAAKTFEKFTKRFPEDPNCPEAGLLASQCFLKLGKTEKAVKISKAMAARFPKSDYSERGANVQAIAAMESKDFDAAIDAWNVILESDAKEFQALKPEAKYEIACCLFEKEAYAEAEKALRELFEEYPEWDSMERAYNQLVRVLMAQKKLQEAQDLLADMHGKFPESILLRSLYFQLGTYWYAEGKMPEAEQMFRRVLNDTPKAPEDIGDFLHRNAELKLAWSIFNRGEYQEAEAFLRSLELEPELKSEPRSKQSAEEKEEILANRAELRYLLGMTHYFLRNPSQALKELHEVRKDGVLKKVFAENALEMCIQIYEEASEWESVLEYGAEFCSLYPQAAGCLRTNFKIAKALFHLQKMEEALAKCDEVIAANDPIFTHQTLFLKGEILFAQKQYQKAIQIFYQVIYGVEDEKLQADAMFETAQCFEAIGKKDKALTHYRELLQKFPKYEKAKLIRRKMKKLHEK